MCSKKGTVLVRSYTAEGKVEGVDPDGIIHPNTEKAWTKKLRCQARMGPD